MKNRQAAPTIKRYCFNIPGTFSLRVDRNFYAGLAGGIFIATSSFSENSSIAVCRIEEKG